MSKATDLADALVTWLNGKDYALSFEAKRRLFPALEIKSPELFVSLFAGPRSSERITRESWSHTYTAFLVVQQKIDAKDAETTQQADDLSDLVEAIETDLEALEDELAELTFQGFDEAVERLPFSEEHLQQVGVFSAVVGLEFADNA